MTSLASTVAPRPDGQTAIGASARWESLVARVLRVASAGRTTLIVGPTGSGKEVVAQQLFHNSPRRDRPFVAVNCGALPEHLEESELFGHHRGAFTGAVDGRNGLVRAANRGTLFLDEINSLSLAAQAKILRFLENGEFRAVGSDRVERSEAWVIAASNVDLREAVRRDEFRSDLLYRLEVVKLEVPPLNLRGEDVLLLAEHFLQQSGRRDCHFSAAARRALMAHDWPGNVRELKHKVESASLFADNVIEPADLDLPVPDAAKHPTPRDDGARAAHGAPPATAAEPATPPEPLQRQLWSLVAQNGLTLAEAVRLCERMLIEAALRSEADNRTRAADRLGIHVRTIFKKLAH